MEVHPLSRVISLLILSALLLSACAPAAPTTAGDPNIPATSAQGSAGDPAAPISGKLVIYSGRSEPLIQPVLDAFKAQHPQVEILLKAGGNSELANALIEEQANPQADIFITTELFTVQSLAQQGLFQSYRPVGAERLPTELMG